MAIYQPSQVIPDVRSGLGLGVMDAQKVPFNVSWHINGPSALVAFKIDVMENTSASTLVYTTGKVTTGCPAYGTSSNGTPLLFTYTMFQYLPPLVQSGIANNHEYKLVITQWWSENDSIAQSSASVFITRKTPTLSIATIGTAGVIDTRYYTFTGSYSQAQGDVLNWFRWQIATQDDTEHPFFDSGRITGTMDISAYYDGFLPNIGYAVKLSAETENGVEVDTGWVNFISQYSTIDVSGEVLAGCVGGTDAVLVRWDEIGYIPGNATGPYSISADNILTLPSGSHIVWNQQGVSPISFAAPWSILWKGQLANANATLFRIGQSSGDIEFKYDLSANTLTLTKGTTTLATQSNVPYEAKVVAVLIDTKLYLRLESMTGGLLPDETLYPSASLYPLDASTVAVNTYTLNVSYTQAAITAAGVYGAQDCNYIEIADGIVDNDIINMAITSGTYVPGVSGSDYMLANWVDGNISAGTLNIEGDTIIGFSLYRKHGDSNTLIRIAEVTNGATSIYDYGALSQQGPYTYYLFPLGQNTYFASPVVSGTVMPVWWNWTLMECAETDTADTYTVLAAYRFRLNVETSAISNNNNPSVLNNFTPYPKVQLVPQNFKSATLTGLIGAVDLSTGQPRYVDTIALRDAIYRLSLTANPLFLKNRKGDLFKIRISGAISMQTGDATIEQTQTVTIPWVEVGSAENVNLFSTAFAGVQESEGEFVPQFFVDTADATADMANLRIYKTAYGVDGKIIGDAKVEISGKTLVMPHGMER